MTKQPLSSKTIIANIVAIIAIAINNFMEIFPTTPALNETLAMVLLGINLILRFMAEKPLSPGFIKVQATRSAVNKPSPKLFLVSGTVWFNVISLLVVIINQSMEGRLLPENWTPYLILAVAILNALGRFFVERPIAPSLK